MKKKDHFLLIVPYFEFVLNLNHFAHNIFVLDAKMYAFKKEI